MSSYVDSDSTGYLKDCMAAEGDVSMRAGSLLRFSCHGDKPFFLFICLFFDNQN